VNWHGQPQVVPREDVYRVRIANIRRRHTLIGMAIGGAAGVIIGAAGTNSADSADRAAVALLVGGVGVGIGAAVGGALPIGAPLYQVAGPPRRAAGPAARK
jgi:hypothetical protein